MIFQSWIKPGSEGFRKNRTDMLELVDKLNALNARAGEMSEKRRDRFEQRGQLTPRERLARLLEPRDALARHRQHLGIPERQPAPRRSPFPDPR